MGVPEKSPKNLFDPFPPKRFSVNLLYPFSLLGLRGTFTGPPTFPAGSVAARTPQLRKPDGLIGIVIGLHHLVNAEIFPLQKRHRVGQKRVDKRMNIHHIKEISSPEL